MDFPAGSVPVTEVKEEEAVASGYTSKFKDQYVKLAAKTLEGSAGMPIAVQVVTLPFEDEQCIAAMCELEKALGGPKTRVPRFAPI